MGPLNGAWIRALLVLGLGLTVLAPTVSAAAPGAAVMQHVRAYGRHAARFGAIAKALGITPEQARTAIHDGSIKELARVSHLTPAQVRTKLKSLEGTASAMHFLGHGGMDVAMHTVATELNMTPQALWQAVRERSLTLPAGTTVQSLETSSNAAVQKWLQGASAKHPTLSAQRRQEIAQRIDQMVVRLLTRATTPASTGSTRPAPRTIHLVD